MSYEKQTWVTGDVITAAKLNNMEDGIDDKLIVTMLDRTSGELDASYADLLAAWTAKKQVILYYQMYALGNVIYESCYLINLYTQENIYKASFININIITGSDAGLTFQAATDSEHLKYEQQ